MFTLKDVLEVSNKLNIKFDKFTKEELLTGMNIELERNNTLYEYSCKFNQLKYIEDETDDIIDNLKDYFHLRQINGEIINDCLMAVYEHFQKLDKEFEKEGYEYLYEFSDERIKEECDANEWEYTENGDLY